MGDGRRVFNAAALLKMNRQDAEDANGKKFLSPVFWRLRRLGGSISPRFRARSWGSANAE
jgi:hypothetical protein